MILPTTDSYNYHSHTQFCDGRASMEKMALAAAEKGMEIWGFSPHSPICVASPCNMEFSDMTAYLSETDRLKEAYDSRMKVLAALEIDFISTDFGPHIDYFQNLPLDYRIGSVHFVPNQDGIPIDCDGSYERFARNLKDGYSGDLRYVVEKFFEQELTMLERGGFDILGHFDKIAANASKTDPDIENQDWYIALIDDVIRMARDSNKIIEINTKSLADKNRFFPAISLWRRIPDPTKGETLGSLLNKRILVNSDAHYPEKVNAGREEAIKILKENTLL